MSCEASLQGLVASRSLEQAERERTAAGAQDLARQQHSTVLGKALLCTDLLAAILSAS